VVSVGERLTVETRIVKGFGRLFLVEGKILTGGNVIARATLTLAVGSSVRHEK
jgi:3-hydroxyacyl-[acyl-carrier-protein] dehydratase